jgi:hypothetical protein
VKLTLHKPDQDLPVYKRSGLRGLRHHKIICITNEAVDQGGVLSCMSSVREYRNIFHRPLPTRGNIQLIGGGQSHKKQIVALRLKGYLVPTICQKTNHSKEAVERYIRDFESVKLLSTKFDDVDVISRIIHFTSSVVKQYLDLIPLDS